MECCQWTERSEVPVRQLCTVQGDLFSFARECSADEVGCRLGCEGDVDLLGSCGEEEGDVGAVLRRSGRTLSRGPSLPPSGAHKAEARQRPLR